MATSTPIQPTGATPKSAPQSGKTAERPQLDWTSLRLFGNGRRPRDFRDGVEVRHSL